MSALTEQREAFFTVKTRLDHLRLPSNFHMDDLPLLQKVLSRLETAESELTLLKSQKPTLRRVNDETQESIGKVEEMLTEELGRVTQENNKFRRQMWEASEEMQRLKIWMRGAMGQRLQGEQTAAGEKKKVLEWMQKRIEELQSQNEEMKYKYNQLMEFIHQDPKMDRQYVTRLLKHKQLSVNPVAEGHNDGEMKENKIRAVTDKNRRKTAEELENQILLLQKMVCTREEEIVRLQSIINDQRLYHPMKKHLQQKQDGQVSLLQEQIELLKSHNQELKIQLGRRKMASGSKEALVEQIERLQAELQLARNKEKKIKRQSMEKEVNLRFIQKELQRKNKAQEKEKGLESDEKLSEQHSSSQLSEEYYESLAPKNYHNKINKKSKKDGKPNDYLNSEKLPPKKAQRTSLSKGKSPSITRFPSQKGKNPSNRFPIRTGAATQATSVEEQALIESYEKLLRQKNKSIASLQEQLKSTNGEKGKSKDKKISITSHKNVNTGNIKTSNYVIKKSRNEYITLNTPQPDEEQHARAASLEQRVAELERERQGLVEELNKIRGSTQGRTQKEKGQEYERRKTNDGSRQDLMRRLEQAQQSLINTNDLNISLQQQLNDLLRLQEDRSARQVEPPSEQQLVQNASEVTMLKGEIERLIKIVKLLQAERLNLQDRIRELALELEQQRRGMVKVEKNALSVVDKVYGKSEEKQARNYSDLSEDSVL